MACRAYLQAGLVEASSAEEPELLLSPSVVRETEPAAIAPSCKPSSFQEHEALHRDPMWPFHLLVPLGKNCWHL